MKIAITSTGTSLDSGLDLRFGRAKTIIVYDVETGQFDAIDNTENVEAPQGAGIQAAERLVRLGVECLITGNCGPKAYRALQAADIRVMLVTNGTVLNAIEEFKAGRLTEATSPSTKGHGA
jgi:predicted Fe-Mo cluster-binding NifX family protein